MKKNSKCFPLLFLILLCACASQPKAPEKTISADLFDSIPLGDSDSNARKALGSPRETRLLQTGSRTQEVWLYDNQDSDHFQRAALAFDSNTHRLIAKTLIINEGEAERDLLFLKENKFPSTQFETIIFPQCRRDFFSQYALDVNIDKGIAIEFRRDSKQVESISWSSPQDLAARIERIRGCKQ